MTVRLAWDSPLEDYYLEVIGPDGQSRGYDGEHAFALRSSGQPAGVTSRTVTVQGGAFVPGAYRILVKENVNAQGLFNVTVTTTCPDTGCGSP